MNISFLDFDDMYLLRHLYNGMSQAQAARALFVSQPAITQRIRRLEECLQAPIIDRSARGSYKLNNFGRRAGRCADAVLTMFEALDGRET